ncbi:MAG: LemA family protein [Bacteroidota bacterium]
MITYSLIGFAIILIAFGIIYFNVFIRYKNKVKNAESDIDIQLKRRFDLLPNLVEIVKGYAKHERELFENIATRRTQFANASNIEGKAIAGNLITGLLKDLFVVVENYPDLLADKSFIGLQESLIEIEDSIQMSRRYYNAVVRDFNTSVESFPGLIVAKLFGFKTQLFFEIAFLEKEVIQVKLS